MYDTIILLSFFLGGAAHILATMVEDRKKLGRRVSIMEVINRHPYQGPLSLVFSIAAYIFLFKAGQLNEVAAFSAGYMGDSIVKKIMAGQARKVGDDIKGEVEKLIKK